MLSTNYTDKNSSETNISVMFPPNSTFYSTNGDLYVVGGTFGRLLYIMDVLKRNNPKTADEIIVRLDLL